ncbi:MAG: DUF5916 domain-containing protein [Candidatus Aminicenantaceae bacterium]
MFWSSLHAGDNQEPLRPLLIDSPPVIDGVLDDAVWQAAPKIKGFKTWQPDYGRDVAEDTTVYFAYDRENLYFAFRCFDSRPDRIKTSVSSRDSGIQDDWVGINLDTFNDQQSLHVFYCNPQGIQSDSRFEGNQEDFSIDLVWYSEGRIDEQGYVVEIRIPFKSLRFANRDPVEMGVIFERRISRLSESGTYPALDPVQGSNFLTQTMPLLYSDVKHYRLFELLPAFTYSSDQDLDEGKLAAAENQGNASLTAKFGITSDLILDGTLNPDFSQVESDAGKIDFNLRYSLFYPEKRPFFLEGLEKFNFGGFHASDPLVKVVHTRTIVNPLTGFKLNGKIGSKDTIASIYAMDELPEESPGKYAHFTIFRYKRALSGDSFIGGFYTGRERTAGHNRLLGTDGQLRLGPSSIFGFHLFGSQTQKDPESSQENGHALGLHYYYTTGDWVVMLGAQDIAEGFQTETGYITRTGLSRFRSGVLRMFHLDSKVIQRIDPVIHSTQIRDKYSGLYETYNSFDIRFLMPRNTMLLIGVRYATEVFLAERFNTSLARLIASSQLTKQVQLSFVYMYRNKIRYVSEPYQGFGHDASFGLLFLPTDNLHLELSLVYSDFFRESDRVKEYDYLISRGKVTYQFSKYFFLRAILEYNSFHKKLLTDLLASFTYIPGTVIHLGYGSLYEKIRWEEGRYDPSDRFLETQRGLFFKASYLWRF